MSDYVFSWAEDAKGQMVHVDTVPNGLACGCHCPRCKEPLLARHGKVLAHGFAHHSEDRAANLEICYQVILYKLAEHIIKKLQHIHAPSYYGIYQEQDIYFADVKIDGQYEREDKQPDVVATAKDGTQYLIEFTFSHKVQHKQPVDYQNVNCLEIDLAGQTLESLEDFLLKSSDGRRWMNNEKYFNSIDGLRVRLSGLHMKERARRVPSSLIALALPGMAIYSEYTIMVVCTDCVRHRSMLPG